MVAHRGVMELVGALVELVEDDDGAYRGVVELLKGC